MLWKLDGTMETDEWFASSHICQADGSISYFVKISDVLASV